MMYYHSTRGKAERLTAGAAILQGIAADGGLFVPESIPVVTAAELAELTRLPYQQRAEKILAKFLTDYSAEEIARCTQGAYNASGFDHPRIAPLQQIGKNTAVLELWHGPTSAFKDMALQLLPRLLSEAIRKNGETAEYVILVATSGDTGKAALEGFKDVDQTRIIVFYPDAGVSEIQRLQMVTQEGSNVAVLAVDGNFDDAQTGVKDIFNDSAFNERLQGAGFRLSSANSINWGRLVPQIVYYFSAYADLCGENTIKAGEEINFVVPTGNFGNILAGYYAKRMGLPVGKLICASNSNNVLTDFLQSGTYDRRRTFHKTMSPSMDILISSNLERLLYHITNGDTQRTAKWMKELQTTGHYTVDEEVRRDIQELFWADWADDEATLATIHEVYDKERYLADPHTAVAWQVNERYRAAHSEDRRTAVILSTASPFKFSDSVLLALEGKAPQGDGFTLLEALAAKTGWIIPKGLAGLRALPVLHKTGCAPVEMQDMVAHMLAGNCEY